MLEINAYINNDFKAIDSLDTIETVQEFFGEVHFSHFPVVEEGIYIGSIAADDIDAFEFDKKISDYRYALNGFFARKSMFWLDVLEIFARNQTTIIPVLDNLNKYVGYYEITDVIKNFYETPFVNELGGIIIVEKGVLDFSMSQVVQIVESNQGKVLGIYISEATTDKIQVTIKLALGGLNEIIQTFRRYGFEIISQHQEDTYIINLKERSDYLDKYLNI